MRAAADEGYITATAMADALVRRGVPFRVAHQRRRPPGRRGRGRRGRAGRLDDADDRRRPGRRRATRPRRRSRPIPAAGLLRAAATIEAALASCDVIGGTAPGTGRRGDRRRPSAAGRVNPSPLDLGWIRRAPKVLLHDHLDGGLRPQTIIELAAEQGYGGCHRRTRSSSAPGSGGAPTRSRSSCTSRRSSTPWACMQTPRRAGPGGRRVRRGPGRGRRRVRRGPPRARSCRPGRPDARRGRRGDPGRVSGRRGPGRWRGGRPSSCASWPRRCVRPIGPARSPISPCASATPEWSASTSPVRRPATRRAASPDVFHRLVHANFHLTLHAGEGYGLPSIREALDLGAERLGHGVRIVDDIALGADGSVRLGPLAAYVRDRRIPLELCPTSNVHTGAAASIDTTRSSCSAGCASGSRSTPTTG